MSEPIQPQLGGIDIGGSSVVTVTGDMVGGDKVINVGNITVRQFLAGDLPLDEQLAYFSSDIGLRTIRRAKFASAQFEAYHNAWKSLQALDVSGDDLWAEATPGNLEKFVKQLRETKLVVQEGEIYFEKKDRTALLRILGRFSEFHFGKEYLVQLYARQDKSSNPNFSRERMERQWERYATDVAQQIKQNSIFRLEYQKILEQIRVSFNKRLAR